MQQSLWLHNTTPMTTSTLSSDTVCDICIVGAGLSGVYTAYLLAQAGLRVIVIEAKSIGEGATAHSTGKLTAQHGLFYHTLKQEDAKLYYQVNKDAIEQALKQADKTTYTAATSFIYTTETENRVLLKQEYETYKKIGIPSLITNDTELADKAQLALGMQHETQIHPVHFLLHFAKLAQQAGAQFFTHTRVTQVTDKPTVTTAEGYTIACKKLVLCTHYPIDSIAGLNTLKLTVDRAYLTATACSDLLQGQYISIDSPARTIRTAKIDGQSYFLYGGTSHLAGTEGDTTKYYDTLTQELNSAFDLSEPGFLWSAQDMTTPDSIPFVGPMTKDSSIYIATGFKKWGLSSSLVAAEILRGYFTKKEHRATQLYMPSRIQGRTVYDMLTKAGFISEQFITGYVTRISAPKCTHLGCKTRWNDADETWDCPCHGSRFDKKGNVIEGPAVYPLKLENE